MNRISGRLLLCGLAGLLAGAGVGRSSVPRPPSPKTGPVVVELFTSEGCSSCPPADEFVATLSAEARKKGDGVLLLAFHVDYWDKLGWKDRFASAAASQRQRDYARKLGTDSIYTPQMVIDGIHEFVGSDDERARRIIRREQEAPGRGVEFRADAAWRKGSIEVSVVLRAEADVKSAGELEALAAWVEDGLESKVSSGENRSRTLRHERVVRAFGVAQVKDGKVTLTLDPPADVKAERSDLVVLLQDPKTGAVRGAVSVGVPKAAVSPRP